jgi:hypothetical protein
MRNCCSFVIVLFGILKVMQNAYNIFIGYYACFCLHMCHEYLLCGLVVRGLGYRSGGPSSIPGTTRKKKVVGLERLHSAL